MQKKEVTILVKNNTGATVPVQLLKFPTPGYENATATYTWDVTTENYLNKDRVSIQFKNVNANEFTSLVVEGSFQNVADVINALNGLGIGVFWSFEESGQTFIRTQNSKITYGELNIYRANNSAPAFVDFGIPITYRIQNTANIKIAGWVTDSDGDAINITAQNLPAFCTLNQYDFAGARVFEVSVSPSGGNNGSYSFTLTASDGFTETIKQFNLVVANPASVTNFAPMQYPLSPDPLIRTNGDTTSESYSRIGSGAFSFSSSRSQGIAASAFSGGVIFNSVLLFPGYSSPSVFGEGLIAVVFGTSGSPTLAIVQDTFLIRIQIQQP